jgi:pimeloyl-ACP methyl ester carboxylesterase
MEKRLAERPKIDVPSIVLHGADDGIRRPPPDSPERASFTKLIARRIVPGAGHFVPREKPEAVSSAILELLAGTR